MIQKNTGTMIINFSQNNFTVDTCEWPLLLCHLPYVSPTLPCATVSKGLCTIRYTVLNNKIVVIIAP